MYLNYSEDTSIFLIINSNDFYFYPNLEFIANHLYRGFHKYIPVEWDMFTASVTCKMKQKYCSDKDYNRLAALRFI